MRSSRSNRGFASMAEDKQREIARKGRRASQGGRGGISRGSRYDDDNSGSSSSRSRSRSSSSSGNGRSQSRRGGTSRRGFASMDEDEQREIASMGGRAAHEYGVAHEFTPEEAREAGRKGGRRTSQTHGRRFYQEIGRMGGEERRRELGPEGYAELGRRGGRSRSSGNNGRRRSRR